MAESNFFRLVRLLQLVPRAPKLISTEQLEQILHSEGLDTTRRTLQRDLTKLEGMGFGLECRDKSKPYGWCFAQNADAIFVPGLDAQSALALRLVELHLERLLPKSSLKGLQPQFAAAKQALQGKPVARWLDRVRLIPRSQPLVPPKIDGAVLGVVHEALLENRQIEARYQARGSDKPKDMVLHPLGLVHRESVAYVVATAFDFADVRAYALQRFHGARMSEAKAKALAGFDIDVFVNRGELGFRVEQEEITLVALFDASAALGLEETPLDVHQKMAHQVDGRVRLEARVPDTRVLRSFLLGYGPGVEVLKPLALRRAIAEAHGAAARRYR